MIPFLRPNNFPQKYAIHCAFALALCSVNIAPAGELLIERTLLPDAAPSSFAIGLPGGVNFCYDVVRGGVSYVWRGGFVDVTSVRPNAGKSISPVKLLGEVVYREEGYSPLRLGDPQRSAAIHFKGYRLKGDSIEFIYEIDRHRVSEEVRAAADGNGLVRRFRIEGASPDETGWYVPGNTTGGKIDASGARRDAQGFRFNAAQGLSLEVHFEKATS